MARRARLRASRAVLPALAAAALALGACKVDVEGAPCSTPGAATDCPSGQACGNDRKCSVRAAACVATRCDVGVASCVATGGSGAGSDFVKRCTDADPACGTWEIVPCTSRGLECRTDGGAAECECPPNGGTDFVADPLGSEANAVPHATGLDTPRECRFRKVGDALAAAAAVNGAATVHVRGDPGPVVFGDVATGEAFPVIVAANVTLHAAAPPSAQTVIRADSGAAGDLVTLKGTMHGIHVETGVATGTGIGISCDGVTPTVVDVAVDGGNKLVCGISVTGSCGATLSGVAVGDVAGPALRVDVPATVPVSIAGSTFDRSDVGIRTTGGKVTIGPHAITGEPTRVNQNSGDGIVLTGSTTVDATLDHVMVESNGGTGIVLESTVAAVSVLNIRSCDVDSNGSVSPRKYGPAGVNGQREAGGILLAQAAVPTSFSFKSNRVYANSHDGLAIESSATTWSARAPSCGADSNLFACPVGGFAVSVGGVGQLDANYNAWSTTPPTALVSANVDTALYCNAGDPGTPPVPPCPNL